MKLLKYCLALMSVCVGVNAASLQLLWDSPVDSTGIVRYNLYGRTNGIVNTNYAVFGTAVHPSTTVSVEYNYGVSYSFYAVSVDKNFIESDPSNFLEYYHPGSIPPPITPAVTITSLNSPTKSWMGVNITWVASPTNYAVTNYVVLLEYSNDSNQLMTNRYNTSIAGISLTSLALNDYVIKVVAENAMGQSIVPSSSVVYIYEKNHKRPTNLRKL